MRNNLLRSLLLLSVLTTGSNYLYAQDKGIHFEPLTESWNQILAKAKTEHKSIFVDCYATWCVPCKEMDQQIYPSEVVGEYMNANFISVKLQVDRTTWDNETIKSWYRIANNISHIYSITALPAFLFFSPDNMPLHKAVGAKLNVTDFLQMAKDAQDPDKQYYNVKNTFQPGKLDTAIEKELIPALASDKDLDGRVAADYLSRMPEGKLSESDKVSLMIKFQDNPEVLSIALHFINSRPIGDNLSIIASMKRQDKIKAIAIAYMAQLGTDAIEKPEIMMFIQQFAGEVEVQEIAKKYIQELPEDSLYTKKTLGFIWTFTKSPVDRGFELFYNQPAKVDEIMGKGSSTAKVRSLVYNSEFKPALDKAKKTIITPNFDSVNLAIEKKYDANLARQVIVNGKVDWYKFLVNTQKQESYRLKLNDAFIAQVKEFRYDTIKVNAVQINNIAYDFFQHDATQEQLDAAAGWMKNVVGNYLDIVKYNYFDTYACILYKAGYKTLAIEWEEKAEKTAVSRHDDNNTKQSLLTIEKMKKGEKIWEEKEYQDN